MKGIEVAVRGGARGLVGLVITACAVCAAVPVSSIQGSGTTSPMQGQSVTVIGVVTGWSYSSGSSRSGFWVQTPDGADDGNEATSEGLYIGASSVAAGLSLGDLVTLSGSVAESSDDVTELISVSLVSRVSGQTLPAAVSVALPFSSSTQAERWEGMRVTYSQTLAVTENYYLGRYGEFALAAGGPLRQATDVVAPGSAAQAYLAASLLNYLVVDDGRSASNPSPTPFVFGGATSADDTLRLGDTVTGLTGVLTQIAGDYAVVPTETPVLARPTPRPDVPDVGGTLRVVSANLLNYFNGDGAGGGFPTSRGATTPAEFARQRAHTVTALHDLHADILAVTELENDGSGATSAGADLVAGLDAADGATGTWALIVGASPGTDAITNAFIYRVATVVPVGNAVTNNLSTFERPPLAQTFREAATGAIFTLCVNHFRARTGSPSGSDADQGDGQGTYNYRRTQQAQALVSWLSSYPTGIVDSNVLIVGDLNSYALEDPLTTLANGGYTELVRHFAADSSDPGADDWSYLYDGHVGALDHALASSALLDQVTGAAVWHNNAAEPVVLDYNEEYKAAAELARNDGSTPWRASDHDPLVVGLRLTPLVPVIDAAPAAAITAELGTSVILTVSARGEGNLSYAWKKDGQSLDVTTASLSLPSVTLADAGSYSVTVSNRNGSTTVAVPALLTVVQSYGTWAAARGLVDADAAPASDPDGDGRSNLLAYALGGARDVVADPALGAAGGGGFSFTFSRPVWATGLSYAVEMSTDLTSWIAITVEPELVASDAMTGVQTLRVAVPASAETTTGRVFVRLRVVQE